MKLKSILLGAVMALAPSVAAAEYWEVFRHKHWNVEYVAADENSDAYCRATIFAQEQEILVSISSDKYTTALGMFTSMWNFGPIRYDKSAIIQIDRKQPWRITGSASKSGIFYTLPNNSAARQFIREVMFGHRLYVYTDGGYDWDFWVSLAGSRAALHALADCEDKL